MQRPDLVERTRDRGLSSFRSTVVPFLKPDVTANRLKVTLFLRLIKMIFALLSAATILPTIAHVASMSPPTGARFQMADSSFCGVGFNERGNKRAENFLAFWIVTGLQVSSSWRDWQWFAPQG